MTADKLDEMLADPWDERNPAGYPALIAADERGELPEPAGRLLEDYGLAAEFVPADLGGRYTGPQELTAVLRTVWRRDPRLGIAYGHAETGDEAASPARGRRRLRLSGLRGLEFDVAEPAFSASFSPSLLVGPFDTAFRTALANSFDRRLYGAGVAEIPFVRSAIARTYADLLAVDALSPDTPAAGPEPDPAPGAEQLAYRIVQEAFGALREILGARALLRTGPTAIFQKTARDVAAVISLRPRRNAEPPVTPPTIRGLLRAGTAERLAEAELLAVRDRLARRLGQPPPLTHAERAQVERQLFETAAARYHDRRLFDPTARRIPG